MFELITALKAKLAVEGIPHTAYGTDPSYVYYPQRMGYTLRFRQSGDADYVGVFSEGGDWVNDLYSVDEMYQLIAEKHFKVKATKDFRTEEIGRLMSFDRGCRALSTYARNLNLMALEGKTFRAYGREDEIMQTLRIMLRKTKPNTLLVGPAGCGKTAVVETLAHYIVDARLAYLQSCNDKAMADLRGEESDEIATPLFNDTIIYDLDIASMVAGTKYRGEFEERLSAIIAETEKNPNIVLFIDEVHQLNAIGNAEGASNMGQLLKPALARGAIHCIGATTDEEAELIYKDRALARRFNKVRVLPLSGEKAVSACDKILKDYSKHHDIAVEGISGAELYEIAREKLKETSFPDNVINLIDETMAGAKLNRQTSVSKEDFDSTLLRLLGADIISIRIGFQS